MIYFVQREIDNAIYINFTKNLREDLLVLESIHGNINLLGILPGTNQDMNELYDNLSMYKVEGDDWLVDYPQIHEFIDATATLDEDFIEALQKSYDAPVRDSARYKSSEYTPVKQQSLADALEQQINLVVNITNKWGRPKPYLYFDLHSGPGVSEDGQAGSPEIFRRIAQKYVENWKKFRFEAQLFEVDALMFKSLDQKFGTDPRFLLHNTDHDTLSFFLNDIDRTTTPKMRKWVFGAVYADPSNATLPWDLLEKMNIIYPRIDIMINIACASYKRSISQVGYETLAEKLPRIKKQWIVRKPFGKQQWSILVGSNWTEYPAWEKKQFYPWDDGSVGTEIFERLVYTENQRRAMRQSRLPGF